MIALILIAGVVLSAGVLAQTPPQPDAVAFDVVSIRQSANDGKGIYTRMLPSGIYTARNMPLSGLFAEAYGHGLNLIGAPNWLNTAEFDISAKTDLPKPGMYYQRLMRALLADRFKLALHSETREGSVYLLTMARTDGRFGPLLRRAQGCDPKTAVQAARTEPPSPDRLPTCNSMFGPTRQTVGNAPLLALIHNLPRSYVNRPVIDKTGLTGSFDWDLQWDNDPTGASTGVSIFSALQEQLGLKLEPGRGPVEVLVIDRVEMPVFD